jgi:hypothetical protein
MNTTTAPGSAVDPRRFKSFAEFYPFYLTEHADRTCRRLHFAGSTLSLLCLVALVVTLNPWWLLAGLVAGYGFAGSGTSGSRRTSRPRSSGRFTRSWATGRCTATSGSAG